MPQWAGNNTRAEHWLAFRHASGTEQCTGGENTVDLPTWEELTDIRDTLNTAIDKELSRTTSDALFLALRRVKADLNADINTRLEQSARIIQRTPDEVLPALVLAATGLITRCVTRTLSGVMPLRIPALCR